MANWGLLGGIGRGLNQFGDTLNRGLAEDRKTERNNALEAKRQASIEKRWAKQDAEQLRREKKSDERYLESQQRQAERDKKSDEQFDKNLSAREGQVIERNLSGIMKSKQDAEQEIVKRYQKQAVDSMGVPLQGEALTQLQASMQNELTQVRQQFSNLLTDRVNSYGDKLRGTGFAYLLDVPDTSPVNTTEVAITEQQEQSDPNESLYQKVISAGQSPSNKEAEKPTLLSESNSMYFGDPNDPKINAFQSIGRSIGNALPFRELTEEEKRNSHSGLMPRTSLLQLNN